MTHMWCAYGDKYGVQYTLTCPYMHTSSVSYTLPSLQCRPAGKINIQPGSPSLVQRTVCPLLRPQKVVATLLPELNVAGRYLVYIFCLHVDMVGTVPVVLSCLVFVAPLQEPTDQEVVRGRNASFHCHTRSRSADWMVLEGQIFTPIENYSTMLHYTIREESRNESTTSRATVLTVTTSEWIDNLTIVCSYGPNCTTNAAHLVAVSCLGMGFEL